MWCCGWHSRPPRPGRVSVNKLNISGILRTYSEKCAKADCDKSLKKIIRDMKADLKEEMEGELDE